MADMNSRGQILLVGAFTLAVTFIALALVINSAIFAENLASRGQVEGSSDALVAQHAVEQKVAQAIEYANVYENGDESEIKHSISNITNISSTQNAEALSVVDVSYVDGETISGHRIADNAPGGSNFTDNDFLEDWELAQKVDRTRNIDLHVNSGSLSNNSTTAFRLNASTANVSDISNNQSWEMRLKGNGSYVWVNVDMTDPDISETCMVSIGGETNYTIEVSEGLVNGERCSALTRKDNGTKMWFATGVPDGYNISMENGNQIEGNYSMIIEGNPNSNSLGRPPEGAPIEHSATYQIRVDYVYATTDVEYKTKIDIAPEEHP